MTHKQEKLYHGAVIAITMIAAFFLGCTDAQRGKIVAIGNSATVECYSGDTLIFKGKSTGKVSSEQQSDGYHFRNAETGKFMEVSGNCIITYEP